MTWLMAGMIGATSGIAYFGGLWLSVCRLTAAHKPAGASSSLRGFIWLHGGRLVRLLLLAALYYLISGGGAAAVIAALAGFWLARYWLIRRIGACSSDG